MRMVIDLIALVVYGFAVLFATAVTLTIVVLGVGLVRFMTEVILESIGLPANLVGIGGWIAAGGLVCFLLVSTPAYYFPHLIQESEGREE
jgi:hypothetical protein